MQNRTFKLTIGVMTAIIVIIAVITALSKGLFSHESPPLLWDVTVLQDNQVLPSQNGEVRLKKAPFTIRVRIPKPIPVMLNVLDNDTYFRTVQPGLHFDQCVQDDKVIQPFCPAMTIAERRFNVDESLAIGATEHHYLFYKDEHDHRWSRVTIADTGVVFERKVALLNQTPIEQFDQQKLYFIFLVDYRDTNVVNDDELQKMVISFE